MTNTMTYAQAIAIALTAIGDTNAEATDRLKALSAQLAKRGSKGGPTKTQKLNEELKAVIRLAQIFSAKAAASLIRS